MPAFNKPYADGNTIIQEVTAAKITVSYLEALSYQVFFYLVFLKWIWM